MTKMNDQISAGYTRRDAILYALGIGCTSMRYIYENDIRFCAFPTIAIALSLKGDSTDVQPFPPPFFSVSSVPVNGPVLDGERLLELSRPLRASESFKMSVSETAVARVGSGAVVQSETILRDSVTGEQVVRLLSNTFYVGSTEIVNRGVLKKFVKPVPSDRVPDCVVERSTLPNQTALYRLSGDYNPLHIDPEIASVFGYHTPILHGLCTLGFAVNLIVEAMLNGDESLVCKVACRFSKPGFPGKVFRVEMWKELSNRISFRVIQNKDVIIDQAWIEFNRWSSL